MYIRWAKRLLERMIRVGAFVSLFRKTVRKTNNIQIKHKMIISFVLVVFVPVLFVGVFLTTKFRETVLDNAILQMTNNVDKVRKQTETILQRPLDISSKLVEDTRLKNVVSTHYTDINDVVQAYRNFGDFREYIRLYKEIANIRFYTTNNTMLNNWDFIQPDESITNSFWYQDSMKKTRNTISWFYAGDETKNNVKYVSLIRRVFFPEYKTSGVLVITIDPVQLNMIVSQEPFETMILDGRGFIVASKNSDVIGKNIDELDFVKGITDKPKGIYETEYKGKPSKIVINNLLPEASGNGLKIVSAFTIDSIVSDANRISKLGFFIIVISLIVAVALIYISSFFLSKRLLLLNRQLNMVAMGNLYVTSTIDGSDEVGVLSRQFNNMVSSIRGLMEEVQESNRQKSELKLREKDIKLKMMASQINPHFLFNALESIRMRAHTNGETEIAAIVRQLGRLMRRSIEIGTGKKPLKEELEIVRSYLEIQCFRYGGSRLSFDITADSEALTIPIPILIVQPLVENAVLHGLESVEEGGIVRVRATLEDDLLSLEVSDNGVGVSPQKMQELDKALSDFEEGEEYRIGLRNVHQRLILTYGEPYGLSISSRPLGGTRVYFSIPVGRRKHVQSSDRG
jgi:two-component system sensor histidine kinase YesM